MPDEYPEGFGLYCAENNLRSWLLQDLQEGKLHQTTLKSWIDDQKSFSEIMNKVVITNQVGTAGILEGLSALDEKAQKASALDAWLKLFDGLPWQ